MPDVGSHAVLALTPSVVSTKQSTQQLEFLDEAFYDAPCESTSCGVKQVAGGCAPTPAPTPGALGSDGATTRSAALCLAVAALLVLV